MTGWVWEYLPDAEYVVGSLDPEVKRAVERLAERLADAADARYLGDPDIEDSGVSPLLDHAEGRLIVWYQEHRRFRSVFILRVQHWPASEES